MKQIASTLQRAPAQQSSMLAKKGEEHLVWLANAFSTGVYVLELPEYRGVLGVSDLTLPVLPYARALDASPLLLKWERGALSVGHQPLLRLNEEGGEVLWGWEEVSEGSGAEGSQARVEGALRAQEDAFMRAVGLSGVGLVALNVVPKLMMGGEEEVAVLLHVVRKLAARGHGFVDLVVRDSALKRAGAMRLELLQSESARWHLKLQRDGWVLRRGEERRRGAAGADEPMKVSEALTELRRGEVVGVDVLAVELSGEVSLERAVKVLGGLRYKQEGGEVVLRADGSPEVSVRRMTLRL